MEEDICPPELAGSRLDAFIVSQNRDVTRSYVQKLIGLGVVTISSGSRESVPRKSGEKVKAGDVVRVDFPEPEPVDIVAEDIPLDILYEDDDVILVNKPKGMVVHPAAGHSSKTLVNALMYHCRDSLSGINGELRPGIVHRIDRDTTGVIIACKNDEAHLCIAGQLKEHTITRRYTALVHGVLKDDEGCIDAPIGRDKKDRKKMAVDPEGKHAVTHYRVLERFSSCTLVECRLETGRTHQIRVHMSHIGHPLVGDEVYGPGRNTGIFKKFPLEGQCLHARVLGFIHPRTGEYKEFHSELPEYFCELLSNLRQNS